MTDEVDEQLAATGDDDEHDERADVLREVLAGSKRWAQAVSKLRLLDLVQAGPIDFGGCTLEEARAIVTWARGTTGDMPARLATYIAGVKRG